MKNTSSGLFCWFALSLVWLSYTSAVAQDTTTPSPDLPLVAQGVPGVTQPAAGEDALTNAYQIQTNNALYQGFGPSSPGQIGSPYLGSSALAGPARSPGFYVPTTPGLPIWGSLQAYPHMRYSLTYGNGFQTQPGSNSASLVNTVAPGVLFKLGEHWTLDYTPTLHFYTSGNLQDTTDEEVMLRGGTTYENWKLSLSQSYIDTTQPIIETGTQIEQSAYSTTFVAIRELGSKMSLESVLDQTFRYTTDLTTLHEWSDSEWLNYQFIPQFGAALGISGGYNELSVGSDIPFQKVSGRITFRPGPKLSLTVEGGAEESEFIHAATNAPSTLNPIFDVSAVYLFREKTTLTLNATRTVIPSLYQNELNVTTIVTADFHTPVSKNWSFDLTAGYTSEPFYSIVPGPEPVNFGGTPPRTFLATTRTDSRTNVRVSLSRVFHTRFTGSILYF
jgi:hypothetical protein